MHEKHGACCLTHNNQSLGGLIPGQEEAYDSPALSAFLETGVEFFKPWQSGRHPQKDSLMAARQMGPKVFPEVSETLLLFTQQNLFPPLLGDNSWLSKKAWLDLPPTPPGHPLLLLPHTGPGESLGPRLSPPSPPHF